MQKVTTNCSYHGYFNKDLAPEIVFSIPQIADRLDNEPSATKYANFVSNSIFQPFDDQEKEGVNVFDTLMKPPHLSNTFYSYSYIGPNSNRDKFPILDLEVGDVNGDGVEELIIGYLEYYYGIGGRPLSRIIDVHVYEYALNEYDRYSFQELNKISNYRGRPIFSSALTYCPLPRSFVEVTNVSGGPEAEVCLATFQGASGYFGYSQEIGVYSVREGRVSSPSRIFAANQFTNANGMALFISGDADGDAIRVGRPRYYEVKSLQHPLVILNAPPIHFDVINGQGFDLNDCFLNEDPCGFSATYETQQSVELVAETEVSREWAVSGEVTGEISGPLGQFEASMMASYGNSFSKYNNSIEKLTVNASIKASVLDRIYSLNTSYGIYEYPVIEGDSIVAHLLTVNPKLTDRSWTNTRDWEAIDYFPRHETGNLLSYQGYGSPKDEDATLDLLLHIPNDAIGIDPFSNATFGISFETIEESGQERSSKFEVGASTKVTTGEKIFGKGAQLSVSLEGNYEKNTISNFHTKIQKATNIAVNYGNTIREDGTSYQMTPYLYWGKAGELILDYNVSLEKGGSIQSWWEKYYGQKSDPGLNLPFRLDPEKGFNQSSLVQQACKSMTFRPRRTPLEPFQPGDQITFYIGIHNFSLLDHDRPIPVSLHLGDPKEGAPKLRNTLGDTLVYLNRLIRAREREMVIFDWVVPVSESEWQALAPYINNGKLKRVFAQIDPNDELDETYDSNNIGWIDLPLDIEVDVATNLDEKPSVFESGKRWSFAYPNPFTDQVNIDVDIPQSTDLELSVWNMEGQLIEVIAKGTFPSGQQQFVFQATHLPHGIYYYQLQTTQHQENGRLVLN